MDVNKFILKQGFFTDKELTIPIEAKWDYEGIDDAIDQYEETAIAEVVGKGYDFEVDRFPHAQHSGSSRTDINYEFYFFSGGNLTSSSEWRSSYISESFTVQDVFYYSDSFTKSFFKLDFYDTVDEKNQKNYFTVIIPTQQGEFMDIDMARTPVKIRKPKFKLDYIETGDVGQVQDVPTYAFYSNTDQQFRWRDLYTYGFFDQLGRGVDYPFFNKSHYPYKNTIFRLTPDDKGFNINDIIQGTDVPVKPLVDGCE